MRKRRTQKVWEETSRLTLTSAFLFRRLLAAAERQNDTPSDGSVHIIQLLIAAALWVCSRRCRCSAHAWAANLPAHQSTVNLKKNPNARAECQRSAHHMSEYSPPLTEKRKKPWIKIFPPSEKNPPPHPVKSIKNSIQLAPPHPDQLAKALDKQRALDKRGKKSN